MISSEHFSVAKKAGVALAMSCALALGTLAFCAVDQAEAQGYRGGCAKAAGARALCWGDNSLAAVVSSCANGVRAGVNFVDADGDGVCDNYQGGSAQAVQLGAGAGFVDNDGDGVCDNRQSNAPAGAAGAGFVDADGNGVCDRYEAGACGNGVCDGTGAGKGLGHGNGRGCANRAE